MSDEALLSDEAADDERPGDDAADEHGNLEDDDAELVVKLNPAVSESLAKLTQRQSEILRQFVEPITSACAASFSKSMLAGIDTRALQAFSETVSASLPVGFQNAAMRPDQRFHAAASYSLIKPPRMGRRQIMARIGSRTGASGRGGRNFSDRCGRRLL